MICPACSNLYEGVLLSCSECGRARENVRRNARVQKHGDALWVATYPWLPEVVAWGWSYEGVLNQLRRAIRMARRDDREMT